MKSLTDLNNHSQTSLEVSDSRGSKVVFNRVFPLQPLDTVGEISFSTQLITSGGNEIVDIINYTTANVRFRVSIVTGSSPLLTGSTLDFQVLPAELSLSVISGVYTITGITTIEHWDIVKSFIWTLPSNYASSPLWYLNVAILYYDSERNEEMVIDWEVYDPRFYYIAKLSSEFTQSTIIGSIKKFTAALTSSTSLDCPGSRVHRFQATISSASSLVCDGLDIDFAQVNLNPIFTINIVATKNSRSNATLSNAFATSCQLTPLLLNMDSRYWKSNQKNYLFDIDTPVLSDSNVANTYSIQISATTGTLGLSSNLLTQSSSLTLSGTVSQINALFPNVLFYPVKNSTSNTTYSYSLIRNGSTIFTRSVSLLYQQAGTPTPAIYTFNYSVNSQQWIPTAEEINYSRMSYIVVGGGGHSATRVYYANDPAELYWYYGSSGGGAGQVQSATNQTISSSSYNVVVGRGGIANMTTPSSNVSGQSSQFNGLTSIAGNPGISSSSVGAGVVGRGGTSGNNFAGGLQRPYSGQAAAGGGGGGSGGIGKNAVSYTSGDGGIPLTVSITNYSAQFGSGGSGGGIQTQTRPPATIGGDGGTGGTFTASNGSNGIVIISTHI